MQPSNAFDISNIDCSSILDALVAIGVYVITEDTHQILYYNKRVREVTPQIELGMVCHELWNGSCDNCPINLIGEQAMAHTINYNDPFGDVVEITATRMMWQGRIPAFLIRVWPRFNGYSTTIDAPEITSSIAANEVPYDYVTSGYSRIGLIQTIEKLRENGAALDQYVILYLNIRGFKSVNELFSFDGGDNLLRSIFSAVKTSKLNPLLCARVEADHFVFLVNKNSFHIDVLSGLLVDDWKYGSQNVQIHCSCGIYYITDSTTNVQTMIDRAKLAKEYITDEYKAPYAVYEPTMERDYLTKVQVLAQFETALKNGELEVFYQPIIDAKTGKIASAEALIRWRKKDRYLPPNDFLPILEQFGYITKLDEYVAKQVVLYLHKRCAQGKPIVPISINISQIDFLDREKMDHFLDDMTLCPLPTGTLCFEVTETSNQTDTDYRSKFMERLQEAGARIYLDDFGSGFSSMEMLLNNDFDVLKIDMAFIRQLSTNPKASWLICAIISACHEYEIQVVAEGVEHEHELQALRKMGCDFIQGYYYSKPLQEADFSAYLEAHL